MRSWAAAAVFFILSGSAFAGFGEWTVETTNDPFSGGQKVVVDYSSSLRAGVFVTCDSSESGLIVRVVAGWQYDPAITASQPMGKFAFDGKMLMNSVGAAGAFDSNIAGVTFVFDEGNALKFAKAMKGAKTQVAIQDGISNQPHLLSALGGPEAGKALEDCLVAHGAALPVDPPMKEGDEDASHDIGIRFAQFVALAFTVQEKCKDYRVNNEIVREALSALSQSDGKQALQNLDSMKAVAESELTTVSCAAAAAHAVILSGLPYDRVWAPR